MTEEKEQNKEESKEQPKESFRVVEIPTKTELHVIDSEKEQVWDDKKVQAEILNKLKRIEKLLG